MFSVLLVFCLGFAPNPAFLHPPTAQVAQGAIRGRVVDAQGSAIGGAAVQFESLAGSARRQTVSGVDGTFTFEGLAEGAYLVTASFRGHDRWTNTVEVNADRPTSVEVRLVPAGLSESVAVTATRVPTPVTAVPNTVTLITPAAVERRTAISDDLPSLLEANVPGFAPSMKKLTGRGETLRGRNPLYAINGVPQHTPLRDGERDGHTIDLDFIERIEVLHGANAIQGIGATGGVVNMITKSPAQDGSFTQHVKVSVGNSDDLEENGWSSKLSYLAGKRFGRADVAGGFAVQKRGLFYDARGAAIGLYPTQGDIMDSTSRAFYGKGGFDFSPTRRLEVMVNDFRLARDGDFVAVPGNRALGQLSTTASGDPRPKVGAPAVNDVTTVSIDYRDRSLFGGTGAVQVYWQDYWALFEGGSFTTFALEPGGPAFLDQSAITMKKLGAKLTWTAPAIAAITPTFGLDLSQDESAQILAVTGRTWVPETLFRETSPFVQLQRLFLGRVLVSGGARVERATLEVDDFTTLPSSRSTFVAGGAPSFTEVLPNAGVVVPLAGGFSTYASLSEGFTMPDAGRVLRAVNTPGQDVDSLLTIAPVVAGNAEVGADFRRGPVRAHAAYYRSVSQQGALLERDAEGIFSVRRQPTTIEGIDVSGEVAFLDGWRAGANYSWIQGAYDSNRDDRRDTDLDGLNIAPNRLNLFLDAALGDRLSARTQISSLYKRTFAGLAVRPGHDFGGYTTADLSLGFDTRAGLLRLGVENLLDKQYVIYFSQVDTVAGNDTFFAGPGRSFRLSFERRF